MSLRSDLSRAIAQRKGAQWRMATRRRDHDRIRAAIMLAEAFLTSYPAACDERVRDWCRAHRHRIEPLFVGGTRTLARLTQ